MTSTSDLQRDLTQTALLALGGAGFVLAGSGAIREHGLIDRPTEDIDLFTADIDVEHFARAVDRVVSVLQEAGHSLVVQRSVERFARLEITAPTGEQVDVDLGVDWREFAPVVLDIGPVLDIHDAVGNKMSALYSRAYPRDFLDVDSIRASGRFSDDELLRAAADRDLGFELPMFAMQLELATRLRPEQVAQYGVEAHELAALQGRFVDWARTLRSAPA